MEGEKPVVEEEVAAAAVPAKGRAKGKAVSKASAASTAEAADGRAAKRGRGASTARVAVKKAKAGTDGSKKVTTKAAAASSSSSSSSSAAAAATAADSADAAKDKDEEGASGARRRKKVRVAKEKAELPASAEVATAALALVPEARLPPAPGSPDAAKRGKGHEVSKEMRMRFALEMLSGKSSQLDLATTYAVSRSSVSRLGKIARATYDTRSSWTAEELVKQLEGKLEPKKRGGGHRVTKLSVETHGPFTRKLMEEKEVTSLMQLREALTEEFGTGENSPGTASLSSLSRFVKHALKIEVPKSAGRRRPNAASASGAAEASAAIDAALDSVNVSSNQPLPSQMTGNPSMPVSAAAPWEVLGVQASD